MSEQRDQMRQATSAKVCLDLAKSARFIVSALSTASFNRPLLALSTICRCPSRSKERSWPRNRGHLANVHLYHSSLRSDDVRVARNGESISFRDLSRSVANDSEGGLEALYQEYRSGSSIVLLFLHERWPPLKLLCQSLSSELSSRIQANMYLTPPQAQALKTHYDTHDVLVLQIHGKKRWRLFDRAVQLPLSHQRYTRSCHRRGPRCRLARPSTVTCTTPTRLGSGPSSRLNTRLRCRKSTGVSVTRTDEKICVVFHSKCDEFPQYVEEDIRFITEAGEFAPCELPGNLDPKSKLVLVSRLLVEGLLTTQHS